MTTTDQTLLPFFVYGTLRKGCGNYQWALDGRTTSEANATLAGAVMYDNGGFPYVAVTAENPDALIVGEVMAVSAENYADVLADLDRLEGFRPGSRGNHYDRIVVTVTLATGEQVQAYTYVAGDRLAASLTRLPVIPSGDWKQRDRGFARSSMR